MTDLKRQNFLKTKWSPYPVVPSDAAHVGRVCSLSTTGLELRREGLNLQIATSDDQMLGVLKPGDLIAVSAEGLITLLAPTLGDNPLPSFDFVNQSRWNQFLNFLRGFFFTQNFLEVKTPTLVECPGTEPSLDVFSTELKIGSQRKKLFLPTSPELHLKKLLSAGAEKIFEIAPCFRNGELTDIHQPEFLMLEWYRAFRNLESIKQDVIDLIQQASQALAVPAPKVVKSYSVAQLFRLHCDFDLKPETTLEELKDLAKRLSVDVRAAQSIDDFFFLIFLEKIESRFSFDELVFVEKYPPYQAALARIDQEGWGERFEVYWKGMELANAFHELNDPQVQRSRFAEDLKKKREMEKEEIPLDQEFLKCLDFGMPPSAGIALGVERLFMALTDEKTLVDIRLFSERNKVQRE